MKTINIKYDVYSRISTITADDERPYMIDGESGAVTVAVEFPEKCIGYFARAYIKSSKSADVVDIGAVPEEKKVMLVLEERFMQKGTLYIGFELCSIDESGAIDYKTYLRFEKVRLNIESFVELSDEAAADPGDYTVTVKIGNVSITTADKAPSVKNVGTARDVELEFEFPRGITFVPRISDGVLTWERDNTGEASGGSFDLKEFAPTKVSQLENDKGYLTEHQDISGKLDKLTDATAGNIVVFGLGGALMDGLTRVAELARKDFVENSLSVIEAIAKGRAAGYVFDTVSDLDNWLTNADNVANLVLGDNFYIRQVDVPDYWWDGAQKQQLETQKADLTEYVKQKVFDDLSAVVKNIEATSFTKQEILDHLGLKANEDDVLTKDNRDPYTPTADYHPATRKFVVDEISAIEAIAKGRAAGYVFDTVSALDAWLLNSENTSKLVVGDNFYIRQVDVPDYWWDGTQKQQLETQKVDLTEYPTKQYISQNYMGASYIMGNYYDKNQTNTAIITAIQQAIDGVWGTAL